MSVNSTSSSSLFPPNLSCINSRMSIDILTALCIAYVLFLLPLFALVLYVGYQRWRKQRSGFQAVMNSHSDIFTFNMIALELLDFLGTFLYCYGTYINQQYVMIVGKYIFEIIAPAQILFHLLTCADRYLAVVHPITYLSLREKGRVRIRNIIISCVWLFCVAALGLTIKFRSYFYMITNILFLIFSFITTSFCSFSILPVLVRSGPGKVGGNRERVDQSKLRAFYTIMAITGALLLKFVTILVFRALVVSSIISYSNFCIAMAASSWLALPSSLVLPLLFLHRAGKLPGSKLNPGSV